MTTDAVGQAFEDASNEVTEDSITTETERPTVAVAITVEVTPSDEDRARRLAAHMGDVLRARFPAVVSVTTKPVRVTLTPREDAADVASDAAPRCTDRNLTKYEHIDHVHGSNFEGGHCSFGDCGNYTADDAAPMDLFDTPLTVESGAGDDYDETDRREGDSA